MGCFHEARGENVQSTELIEYVHLGCPQRTCWLAVRMSWTASDALRVANPASPVAACRRNAPSLRACWRQPNNCCGCSCCHRRATSETRAPGTNVSATIRAFSSADHRRRRPGPVSSSNRRKPPFVASVIASIRITRSPSLHAVQALSHGSWKNGSYAALTINRRTLRRSRRAESLIRGPCQLGILRLHLGSRRGMQCHFHFRPS